MGYVGPDTTSTPFSGGSSYIWSRLLLLFLTDADRRRAAAPRYASMSWRRSQPVALGTQTATAAAATARENDTARFCIKLDPQHPAFDHQRNQLTPIFRLQAPRSKDCGAVHLSVRKFMPRPFTSETSQPINNSCGFPATARSQSSATRAASV